MSPPTATPLPGLPRASAPTPVTATVVIGSNNAFMPSEVTARPPHRSMTPQEHTTRMRHPYGLLIALLLVAGCGGGSSTGGTPTSPTPPPTPPPSSTTITITAAGVSPQRITVSPGTRVTFVNNDSRSHEMNSDPHPNHGECPAIDDVGFLAPGQTKLTGNLNVTRTCGFHDHNQPDVRSLQGQIVVQ